MSKRNNNFAFTTCMILSLLALSLLGCKKDPLDIMYSKRGIWKVYMSVDYKDKNTGQLIRQAKDSFLIDFTNKAEGRNIIKNAPDSSIPFTWEKGKENTFGGGSNHWIRFSSLYYCDHNLFYISDHDRDRESWTGSTFPLFTDTKAYYSAEVVKQ